MLAHTGMALVLRQIWSLPFERTSAVVVHPQFRPSTANTWLSRSVGWILFLGFTVVARLC
jgi:hypothetical protein